MNTKINWYLAPGTTVWWPVKVENGMVEFPFNGQKFPVAECPGTFASEPSPAAALRAIPSEKRSEASRTNGKKGGRPPIDKSCPVCGTWMLDPTGCQECGHIIPSGK